MLNIGLDKEILRLLVAMLCGLSIGTERGLKRRGAGIRTHILVCIGSAVVMLISEKMLEIHPEYISDVSRMGAQVISGIGFLGVGTIIVTGNNQIRGLTTAAGLWTTACIGLAVGIGYFKVAILATVIILLTLRFLGKADDYIHEHSVLKYYYIEITENSSITEILEIVNNLNLRIENIEIKRSKFDQDDTAIVISVEGKKHTEFIEKIEKLECIKYIEILN